MIVQGRSVGSVARYVCNSGFSLEGQESRTCLPSGDWSGVEPTCRRKKIEAVITRPVCAWSGNRPSTHITKLHMYLAAFLSLPTNPQQWTVANLRHLPTARCHLQAPCLVPLRPTSVTLDLSWWVLLLGPARVVAHGQTRLQFASVRRSTSPPCINLHVNFIPALAM